jgi:hypothetical protein
VGTRPPARAGARHDDRGLPASAGSRERVESSDPQPDEVRRRREVRLIARAARRVVADPPRGQVRPELAREVAGADVVGGDDERRPAAEARVGLEQRRQQVGPDRRRSAQLDRLAGARAAREGSESLVLERNVEQ